jgi:caspase domain-containing protein
VNSFDKEPKRYVIATGCALYDDLSLSELPKVPTDIAAIRDLFRRLGYSDALTELANDSTANQLRDGLSAWFSDERREDGDLVVFYYAGHGYFSRARQHYLCTKDFDSRQPLTKGLATAWYHA